MRESTHDLWSVSVGIAQWDMQEALEDLMIRTDIALYKAKKSGRGRVELAEALDDD